MSHTVRYRVPEEHYRETLDGGVEKTGSIHHRDHREFTGLVTHSHDDGSHDIVIFPPDKPPVHVHQVTEGDGPGTVTITTRARQPRADKAPE